MTEAGEWERWEALVSPILEASPSLSEPELGGLTEQVVDAIVQQTRADREHAKAESAALTASLRAANATTRAAQARADKAEIALQWND